MKRLALTLFLLVVADAGALAQAPSPQPATAPVQATPVAPPAAAQPADIHQLLYGSVAPLSLKLKDLDPTWRRVTIAGAEIPGLSMLGSLFGGSAPVYYTKGQTVELGGQTYLVAYKSDLQPLNLMSLIATAAASSSSTGGKSPDMSAMMPPKLTPDTALSLSLLNLRTAGNLTDIRQFDMAQEIANSANGDNGLMDLMMLGSQMEKEQSKAKKPAPTVPAPRKATRSK